MLYFLLLGSGGSGMPYFSLRSAARSRYAIIFSHSEGCLFTLLIVSFDVQKLLRLITAAAAARALARELAPLLQPLSSPQAEEEMATQSSILAWEIPWTEEPGGLQTMGVAKSQIQLSD